MLTPAPPPPLQRRRRRAPAPSSPDRASRLPPRDGPRDRSPVHAILVELLGAHPEALAYLLELRGLAPAAPLIPAPDTEVKVVTLERRLDRVFLLGDAEAPAGFVLTEVQLRRDRSKRFAWPLYLELARTRYRCEGALVILTLDAAVRRWIARRIAKATGLFGTARRLAPTVLAVDAVPLEVLLQPDRPYLAPLAVIAHARTEYVESVAQEAIQITMDRLPDRLAAAQLDAILGVLDKAMRAHLERKVMQHPRFYSETFRRLYAEATSEGWAEGRAEGRAEGVMEARTGAILTVLKARGVPVSEAIRERILRCKDPRRLEVWVRRAAVASSASAVVRPSPVRSGTGGARASASRRSVRRA